MSEFQTPSQAIVASAASSQVHEFSDVRGRRIKWRAPSFLEQVRMLRAIGAEQSANGPYIRIVQVACSVLSIDGLPVPKPTNERGIDLAIEMLGDEGMEAIAAYMDKQMADSKAAAASAVAGVPDSPLQASAS